jgi:hypothetical protein
LLLGILCADQNRCEEKKEQAKEPEV